MHEIDSVNQNLKQDNKKAYKMKSRTGVNLNENFVLPVL